MGINFDNSTCDSITGNIVIGEIKGAPEAEIVTVKFGKNEKYKTINEAIVSIPRNMVKNYQLIDMDNPK